jgi:serine acetyltransferase
MIGHGAIVSIGAVIVKNVPPYGMAGGVLARLLKWRWPVEEILQHELALYPANSRHCAAELAAMRQASA